MDANEIWYQLWLDGRLHLPREGGREKMWATVEYDARLSVVKDFKRFVSHYLKELVAFGHPTMEETLFPPRANFEEICSILDKEWRSLAANNKEDPLLKLLERERELLWLRWFRLGSDKGRGTSVGATVRTFFVKRKKEE